MFGWQSLYNFVYIPLFIFLIGIVIYYGRKKKLALKYFVDLTNKQLLKNYSLTRDIIKTALIIIAFVALFIILLNPSIQKREFVEQKCRDIFIVLDISKSMLAQDIKPNRLEFTKNKIKSLLRLLSGDRAALVLFSSDAFIQCPLTRDFSAFNIFLDQIDPETVSGGSTSLASALKVCMNQYKKDTVQSKVIIIFTDGEDFSSDLLSVKKQAKDLNMKIFTVGIGTIEGGKIPLLDQYGRLAGYQKDKIGKEVITKLNEGIIRNLASEFGGLYIPISENNQDIKTIVKEIQKFEKQKVENKKLEQTDGLYPYFALLTLLLFLIAWLL